MRISTPSSFVSIIATLANLTLALHPGSAQGAPPLAPAGSYMFTSVDIPTAQGEFGQTSLQGMNEDGDIVGGSAAGPAGFLLEDQVRLTTIACPGATDATAPMAINRRGEIAGFCYVNRHHGFFRDRRGRYTFLDVPGSLYTEASDMNDDAQVVGNYNDGRGAFHGFWWAAGRFVTIDVPPSWPATSTALNGINNRGQMVGFWFDNQISERDPNGRAHGFFHDHGVFTSFDVPGANATLPMDINDAGQIVGIYGDEDDIPHTFVLHHWTFTRIEVPFPHVVFTDIQSINDRGQLVGRYLTTNPADVNDIFNHGVIVTPLDATSTPRRAAQADTIGGANTGTTGGLRLSLDTCTGGQPKPGYVTPAKLVGRGALCSR
jgi:hypothetical protein